MEKPSGSNESSQTSYAAPWFHFRIRHLLWITVWVSLLLTVIRLCGIPYEYMLPLLVAWLVFQSATLYVGSRLGRRFNIWQASPQTRAGR